ncbi:MAG: DOPA 4,5-dioxygenase family protein [Alphaproteobacteria bacterium]
MTNDYENGDETKITYYHAHIYYGDSDELREKAARLRERAWAKWPADVRMGRFRDRAVGPHPLAMYQIEFDKELFQEIVPWLMYNRDGLTILVHPEAEDAFRDHAWYPLWMGERLDLRLDWLKQGNRAA